MFGLILHVALTPAQFLGGQFKENLQSFVIPLDPLQAGVKSQESRVKSQESRVKSQNSRVKNEESSVFFLYYQNIFQHSCAYSKGNRKETSSQSSCYLNHPRNNCHVTRNMPQVTFVFAILIPNSKSTIGHFITEWSFPLLVLFYKIQINKYLQKLFFLIFPMSLATGVYTLLLIRAAYNF